MKVAITADAAAALIPDGASLLIGGFMGVGSPHRLIDALVRRGAKNLTIIANDTAWPGRGSASSSAQAPSRSWSPRISASIRRRRPA